MSIIQPMLPRLPTKRYTPRWQPIDNCKFAIHPDPDLAPICGGFWLDERTYHVLHPSISHLEFAREWFKYYVGADTDGCHAVFPVPCNSDGEPADDYWAGITRCLEAIRADGSYCELIAVADGIGIRPLREPNKNEMEKSQENYVLKRAIWADYSFDEIMKGCDEFGFVQDMRSLAKVFWQFTAKSVKPRPEWLNLEYVRMT